MEESMKDYQYITLRQQPELKNRAAEWFHGKWGVPQDTKCLRRIYRRRISL